MGVLTFLTVARSGVQLGEKGHPRVLWLVSQREPDYDRGVRPHLCSEGVVVHGSEEKGEMTRRASPECDRSVERLFSIFGPCLGVPQSLFRQCGTIQGDNSRGE